MSKASAQRHCAVSITVSNTRPLLSGPFAIKRRDDTAPTTAEITAYAAQQLKRLRKQQGLTQQTLATQLGITFQMIQKYEKGTCRISLPTLHQLAEALGTTPTTFLLPLNAEQHQTKPMPKKAKTTKHTLYITVTEDQPPFLTTYKP